MNTEQVAAVDTHVDTFVAGAANEGMNAQALQLFSICAAWQKVRPIVNFAKAMLFWKPKWQAVITEFEGVADGICPATS